MTIEVNDQLIKKTLASSKTVAMVGVSSIKKENASNMIFPIKEFMLSEELLLLR